MKILIVSQYYYPEQFQINEIAPELVRRGHEVTVVCGLPNYPKGKIFQGYESRFEEVIDGVNVIRCKQVPRGDSPIQLVRNYWSFVRESKKVIQSLPGDFDVVLGYQLSPITSMLAALEYKKRNGTPVVYYTLDIWPASAEAMLHGKNNPVYWWVKNLSKKIYLGADKVLVTSRPFIDYLRKTHGLPADMMDYLPQHASPEMLDMNLEAEGNGIADFMFAGNIGKGQRVDVIIKAAAILGARKDYKIHIVGDGRMREELEKQVKENGLEKNVVFYGNQKRDDMPSFYKKADVLLITLRGNNEVGNTMPGKLQMYMTTGKPILGAINGAAREVIEAAQCGSCVKAGDYQGLAKLMEFYIQHPKEYDVCGKNARYYFRKHFTLNHFINGLEAELKQLVEK